MRNLTLSLVAVALGLGTAANAQFNNFLSAGEVDFSIKWDPADGWEFEYHDETNNAEYDIDDTLLVVLDEARVTRPIGPEWDFLGVAPGEFLWVLPQNEIAGLLYLGVGSEEMPGNTFDEYFEADSRVNSLGRWIKTRFAAVRGPGQFSVWTTDQFGAPTVWASSLQGLTTDSAVFQTEGGHEHYNWGFTQLGRYEVDVFVSAFKDGSLLQSDVVTLNFEVVPEPATLLALGAGLAAVAARRRRK